VEAGGYRSHGAALPAYATQKAEKGVSAYQLHQWLGHARLNTTQIYVRMCKKNAGRVMEQK
jgi:site-specific recombinase XerD